MRPPPSQFDKTVAEFAVAYADQTERDYEVPRQEPSKSRGILNVLPGSNLGAGLVDLIDHIIAQEANLRPLESSEMHAVEVGPSRRIFTNFENLGRHREGRQNAPQGHFQLDLGSRGKFVAAFQQRPTDA